MGQNAGNVITRSGDGGDSPKWSQVEMVGKKWKVTEEMAISEAEGSGGKTSVITNRSRRKCATAYTASSYDCDESFGHRWNVLNNIDNGFLFSGTYH